MYICTYTYIFLYIDTCRDVGKYIFIYVCMHVCMYETWPPTCFGGLSKPRLCARRFDLDIASAKRAKLIFPKGPGTQIGPGSPIWLNKGIYRLNHKGIRKMIQAIFLNETILGSLGVRPYRPPMYLYSEPYSLYEMVLGVS